MRFASLRAGGIFLAVAGLTALSACSSSSSSPGTPSNIGLAGQYGSIPAEHGTVHAGMFKIAFPPNSAPTWVLPMPTASANTVYNNYEFNYQMYRPLYWFFKGVEPTETASLSLADDPVWSNGNKTVSITLKSNYKWSDGQPLISKDVLFWFDILKAAIKESPANWAPYTPGLGLPDEVASASTPSASTIVFNLTKPVNPTWFWQNEIGSLEPMPSHAWAKTSATGGSVDFTNPANATKIYNYLAAQSKTVGTYATNPLWQVVDGPYKLSSFNSTTGAFTMVYNTNYGGPHVSKVSGWEAVPFTSDTAEFNAVKAGTLNIGYVPLTDVPQIASVKSAYDAFGYPEFGWEYITYNFKDTTGDFKNIISQLYIRQALAHLENEPGYIKAFFYGAAGQAYGPVPSIPKSPYTPANAVNDPYPFSTSAAAALLKAHGWSVVPGGTDTCQKPGTGANECGAGIPAGTKLAWNLIANNSPAVIEEQDTDFASEAKTVGITINLSTSNFNHMIQTFNDPAAPKDDNLWAMEDFGGFSNSTYPTTFGVFNSTGSSNVGGYTDPQADKLINSSISSPSASAVTAEAAYLTTQQPGLFQPNGDWAFTSGVIVLSKDLSGDQSSLQSLTENQVTPELWYFTKLRVRSGP